MQSHNFDNLYKRATLSLAMKGMMKLLFFGFFSLFLFSFVSAQITQYSQEDVIFRISSPTNAHGEIYSQSTPGYTNIYYSDIFGGSTYAGVVSVPNLRICSGSNRVLRLSADTNAHAREPGFLGTPYSRDVCYGDVVCQAVAGNANCPASYNEVVSLSANDNAHIENANANQYNGAGNAKICCKMTSSPQLLDARWLYYDGTVIPNLASVCRNNVIIARVRTANIADGQIIGFLFSDDDSLSPDPIVYLEATVQNNEARIELNFSDPGVQAVIQSELGGSEGQNLELYFDAGNVAITPAIVTSFQVIYQNDSNLCSFNPPTSTIEAPKHRGVYFVNTNVTFASACSSQIGPVQTEWIITPQNGQPFTRTEATFMHQFTSSGQVNFELKCTDSEGRFDTNESQILVVASPYVLAYINEPALNEMTYRTPPSSGPYFPTEISFSASDSFAVNSISACSIECIGGNCPAQTENSPASCGASGGPINIIQTTNSYNTLFFNWTFFDQDWSNNWSSFETGNGIYSGNVQYDDMSNTLDDKKIRVSVKHTTGASAEFEREFTLGRCLNNGNTYYASRTEFYSTSQNNSACKGGDGQALTADDCCAAGLQCLPDEDDPTNPARYSCQIPPGGPIVECNDFTTQIACNGNTNPAIPLASYGGNPPACTELRCQWSTTSNSCGLNVTTYNQSSTTGVCSSGPGAIVLSSCSYTTTVSACANGRKTITYNTISGGATCDKPSVTVPCGSLSFELSFFTLREFLIAMLLIGTIYLVLNFRKEIKYENKK